MGKALIVVDCQNDFCEGGALAVKGGNRTAEMIGRFIYARQSGTSPYPANGKYDRVIFTADWHKPPYNVDGEITMTNGGHFSEKPDYIDTWPVHCVAGEHGSTFHPAIQTAIDYLADDGQEVPVLLKGRGKPAYSGFDPDGEMLGSGITLKAYLAEKDIHDLDICGIATDYCVKATAEDALLAGYKTTVLYNLTAAVGGEEAVKSTIEELTAKGALRW